MGWGEGKGGSSLCFHHSDSYRTSIRGANSLTDCKGSGGLRCLARPHAPAHREDKPHSRPARSLNYYALLKQRRKKKKEEEEDEEEEEEGGG